MKFLSIVFGCLAAIFLTLTILGVSGVVIRLGVEKYTIGSTDTITMERVDTLSNGEIVIQYATSDIVYENTTSKRDIYLEDNYWVWILFAVIFIGLFAGFEGYRAYNE